MTAQNFSKYRKHFAIAAVFVCSQPIGARLTHGKLPFVFPPLGDSTLNSLAIGVSTVLAGVAAILPWLLEVKTRTRLLVIICFLIALLMGAWYFYLTQEYVVTIPLPEKPSVSLSVGCSRSKFALDQFPGATNFEMLEKEGPYEEDVQKLWTPESIRYVRLLILLSYLGWLIPINFILGIFANGRPDATQVKRSKLSTKSSTKGNPTKREIGLRRRSGQRWGTGR